MQLFNLHISSSRFDDFHDSNLMKDQFSENYVTTGSIRKWCKLLQILMPVTVYQFLTKLDLFCIAKPFLSRKIRCYHHWDKEIWTQTIKEYEFQWHFPLWSRFF